MSKRLTVALILLASFAATVFGAPDPVLERIEALWLKTSYAEAADLANGAAAAGPELDWWQARLSDDPARFQELALMAVQNPAATPALKRAAALARAREHFAAGRYQSAEGLLRPFAEPDEPLDSEAKLWWGMSLQATGEARAATKALEAVPDTSVEYPISQALLADLNLRAQRPRRAREHAQKALEADADVGAIALGVLEQLARAEEDLDASREIVERLQRDYPRSVELTWVRAAGIVQAEQTDDTDVLVAEERSGPRRTFSLQYGAFRDRALALRRMRQLEREVQDLHLEVDREQSPALYRVVGGSFGTRAQTERARDALASRGIEAFILAPGR